MRDVRCRYRMTSSAEGSGRFSVTVALFAIAISLVTFGADTGQFITMSAQRALVVTAIFAAAIRYGLIPALIASVLLVGVATSTPSCAINLNISRYAVRLSFTVAALMTVFFSALRGLHRVTLRSYPECSASPLCVLRLWVWWFCSRASSWICMLDCLVAITGGCFVL